MTGNQTPNYRELTAQIERLQHALRAATIGTWDFDLLASQVEWSPICKQLFGLSPDANVTADLLLQQVHPTDRDRVATANAQALNPNTTGEHDIVFRTLDGEGGSRWVEAKGQTFRNEQGQLVRFSGIVQDVTEQVIARLKLEETQSALQGAVELAQLGTWSIDVATNGLTYSDRLIEWFGYDPGAQAYTHLIPILEADDQERVEKALAWALNPESGGVYNETYTVIHPITGQKRVLHAQGKTVFDASGKAVRLNGTAQDITLQRELQLALQNEVRLRTEALKASNEELAEANRLLNRSNGNLQEFAYVASHDLQEPLRKIQQFGDLLREGYGPQLGEGLPYLERMQSAARRMSRLIRDLLSYSGVGIKSSGFVPVSLSQVIDTVLGDLDLRIGETGAQIEVSDLPTVEGDASQLGQLFLNLVSNALKFRQPGSAGPVIQIRSKSVGDADLPPSVKAGWGVEVYHRIDVIDNGIGFDQKYADQIFQVFQRLHGKNQYAGTGIGLAICEKVVTNHGGAITASSVLGQGATFSVYLPL